MRPMVNDTEHAVLDAEWHQAFDALRAAGNDPAESVALIVKVVRDELVPPPLQAPTPDNETKETP